MFNNIKRISKVESIIIEIGAELKPMPEFVRNNRTGLSKKVDKDYTTAEEVQIAWDKYHRFDFLDLKAWFEKHPVWDGASTYKGDWANRYVRIWYNNQTQSVILSGAMKCPTCGHLDWPPPKPIYE
jgi:hypothetical protein